MKLNPLRVFLIFLKNEYLLAWRTKESVISMMFFAFIMILIFNMSLSPTPSQLISLIIPFVWLATLLGGMLRMNRTFESENKGRVVDSLRLMPRIVIPFFLSKVLVNFLFILLLEILSFLFVVILFNVAEPGLMLSFLWLPCVLGAFGFTIVGTIFSGMTVVHQRKDLILPVISYPILIPIIAAVINSFVYSSHGSLIGLDTSWLKILASFDVVFFVASLLLFEHVLSA